MDNQYQIDWQGVNLLPGLQAVANAMQGKKADERSREYLQMQKDAVKQRSERESAALKRQQEQDKYTKDVAAFNAMPALFRAAAKSTGMANMNPYGVHFEEGAPENPPSIANVDIMDAKGGQYGAHARAMLGQSLAQPSPTTLAPGEEGPEPTPEGEAARFAPSPAPVEGPEAPGGIEQAQSILAQPQKHPLFATFHGNRFEVPETQDTTGLGQKYDAIYSRMLEEPGVKPADAYKAVMAEYEKDQAEAGRNTRAANALTARSDNREDQQKFLEEMAGTYKLTFEQRKQLAEIMAHARMASAGAATSPEDTAHLAELIKHFEESGSLSGAAEEAAGFKKPLSPKVWEPALKQVTTQATAGERAGLRRKALVATDDRGNVIGEWKDANAAKVGEKQTESFHRVEERLNGLLADIKAQGERSDWDRKSIQKRVSLAKSVVAALRPFNELSNTAAGQQMEEDILGQIGAPGHGWLWGANTEIVEHLLNEARGQHRAQLMTKLSPVGSSPLSPALGGQKQVAGMSDDEAIKQARQRLIQNPNDAVAHKVLQLHGLAQ